MDITIERFKNIESVSLTVDGVSLLVGGNNAGKSSVLQAIQFGASVAQTAAIQGAWDGDRLSTSIGQSDLVYSPIKDVLFLARNGRLREPPAEAIRVNYRDNGEECQVTVRKGRNKNILLELIGRSLGERLQSIASPYCTLVTGLAGIPTEEAFETNIKVKKTAAKGDSNSVFRNILLQLKKDPQKWQRFQEQITRIFNDHIVDVNFDPDRDETINCTVSKAGVTYPIDTCGTGVLQAIQIFSYIHLFEPKILLLDEPDSHLHPNNQKQLARELIFASGAGLNIIVSTHSKHLVESLIENSSLIWLTRGEKQTNVENYELKALLEIGALNVGERIGNPAHIFLTEDKNHEGLRIILDSNGCNLDDCEIISYSGCTKTEMAITLITHLRRTNPTAEYIIHRDKDFLDQDYIDGYIEKFSRMNVQVFLPEGNDLESYFSSSEHIAASCDVENFIAEEIAQAAFNARRPELIEKYVNTRCENIKRSGAQVNAGQLAVEAQTRVNGPRSDAVHGKILMRAIRDELRTRGIPDRLMSVSNSLRSPMLSTIFSSGSPT